MKRNQFCLLMVVAMISSTSIAVKQQLNRPLPPYFPDIEGYQTLVCDLHTHTVFSDGLVWPTVRVDEAYREGLDAVAISDHVEHQPHKDDIPTNHNRSYEIASKRGAEIGMMVVKAAEITRSTPPGHYNALYLDDVDSLVLSEFIKVIEQANGQDAFVFWNHHAWKGEERGKWSDIQTVMVTNGWLHGMEVSNGDSYYPNAHRWCLEHNLTMMGNTDLHQPSFYSEFTPEFHRSLTLVFAKERSLDSIQQALREGRTAVWFKNQLIGRQEYLQKMYDACVTIAPVHYSRDKRYTFEIRNQSFLDLNLKRVGKFGPERLSIPARSAIQTGIHIPEGNDSRMLKYEVENLLIEPGKYLTVAMKISRPKPEEKSQKPGQ